MTARPALLELLCWNLPEAAAAAAAASLAGVAAEELSAAGSACGAPESHCTGRRLALYVPEVPAAASKCLPAVFSAALSRLALPGSCAWEASGFLFPRPVSGLVALHGERVLPLRLAGLKAGRHTCGHDAAGGRRVAVPSADRYFRTLEHAGVLARDPERLACLLSGLAASAARMKLRVEEEPALVARHLRLAEYPVPVVAGFSQSLLGLPQEKLRAALRALGFFAVSDAQGRLQPYLAGFRDGASRGQRNVEEGFRAALEESLGARP